MGQIKHPKHVRAAKELQDIIRFIKARAILEGRKQPTAKQITKVIAKKINKEELLRDVFIRF